MCVMMREILYRKFRMEFSSFGSASESVILSSRCYCVTVLLCFYVYCVSVLLCYCVYCVTVLV